MEPADIPLPPSGASSLTSSRSSSRASWRSASPSPSQSPSEWPFAALRPSRSSSQSSSSWPFVTERSPSPSSTSSYHSWHPYQYRCKPIPAKDWVGIFPPVLPPPNFFDLEVEEKWVREEMFKQRNVWGPLHDETGKVNLPVDEKGILILDPESRTRMIDSWVELHIFDEYRYWIDSAIDEAEELGAKQSADWLRGLSSAVVRDYGVVNKEDDNVMAEERKKRGLTDLNTYKDWYLTTGYLRLVPGNVDNEEEQDEEERDGAESQLENQFSSVAERLEDDDSTEDETSTYDHGATVPEVEQVSPKPPLASLSADSTTTGQNSPATPPLDLFSFWS